MTDIAYLNDALTTMGFTAIDDHPAQHPDNVAALSTNGPYEVLGAWRKGDTVVHLEQNTGPENFEIPDGAGGTSRVTVPEFKFPPVLVIKNETSGGSYAVHYEDLDAFAKLTAGQTDFNENGDAATA